MKNFLFPTLFLFLSFSISAQRIIPELWGQRVHDEAKVLSSETIERIETDLKLFEDSTTNQIAVLIISSLEGEVLEDYSLRVAEAWKLGTEEKDNGVLLLVAISDRKMRIEVGYGLEGVLPDVICNRIIRNEIKPAFRRDDYDGGITAGVNAIMQTIKGEYTAEDNEGGGEELLLKEKILIGLFLLIILLLFTGIALFIKGCASWAMYAFLIPFYLGFMAVLGKNVGLFVFGMYVIGFPILKLILPKTNWGKRISKSIGNAGKNSGRGWSGGSGWMGGGGWSSGSSGGGFSGGGGSFGGGGSSGSW